METLLSTQPTLTHEPRKHWGVYKGEQNESFFYIIHTYAYIYFSRYNKYVVSSTIFFEKLCRKKNTIFTKAEYIGHKMRMPLILGPFEFKRHTIL